MMVGLYDNNTINKQITKKIKLVEMKKILDLLNNEYVVGATVLLFWILALIGLFKSDDVNIYLGDDKASYEQEVVDTVAVEPDTLIVD